MKAGTLARCGLAVLALVVAEHPQAQAKEKKESAFGFYKGMTLKQAQAAAPLTKAKGSSTSYHTESPPTPVPPFTHYAVILTKAAGVCGAWAFSDEMSTVTGQAQEAAEYVVNHLKSRYGEKARSIPGKTIGLTWVDAQAPGSKIELSLDEDTQGKASLSILYFFSNAAECSTENAAGL